ncbi:MAG: flagellar motor switch protein FliN [Phycisphaerales bacterium]|nr:flagellar motor switch protein FliN [Phycisphaerales bacterium]
MPDETPEPVKPTNQADDSAEKIAEDALRAAEQAAGALKAEAAAPPDEAATAALLAATKAAIATTKSAAAKPAAAPAPAAPTPPKAAPPTQASATSPAPTQPTAQALPLDLPTFSQSKRIAKPEGIGMLSDVNLDVKIELGRTRMFVEDVLRLGEGSVVELDQLAGDPVDVFVNERLVARGEVLVLNENFCVRIHEIVDLTSAEVRGKSA